MSEQAAPAHAATVRADRIGGMLAPAAPIALRVAVAAAFLSAVADRFGCWGPFGTKNVAWGDMARFTAYTHTLLPFAHGTTLAFFAWAATAAELVLGFALLLGLRVTESALAAAALTAVFGTAMAISLGAQAPLNFSVFTATAAALALADLSARPRGAALSLDSLLRRRSQNTRESHAPSPGAPRVG